MRILRALPLALAVMLWTTLALAGRLVVTDEAHLLSSSDVNGLQATAARWSFDTHLLVTSAPAKAALENRAKAWVDAPNVVVIALDPDHHSTVVRFGVGSNVKTLDFDSISAAGNPAFREKNWRGGIEAIGARADMSTRTTSGTLAPQAPIVVHEGLGFFGWSLIFLGVGFLVWITVRLYRKSQADTARFQRALDDNTTEMSGLASRNIADERWEAGVKASTARASASTSVGVSAGGAPVRSGYSSSSYMPPPSRAYSAPAAPVASASSTVVVNNGGGGYGNNNGSSFVEGMLVGELLTDRHHDTVIRERDVYVERERPVPATTYDSGGSSGNYDAGGSSSSYGSSSSDSGSSGSSSSNDSGSSSGSSSSWDSSSSSSDSGSSSSWDSGSSSYDSGSSSSDSGSSDSGGGSSDF